MVFVFSDLPTPGSLMLRQAAKFHHYLQLSGIPLCISYSHSFNQHNVLKSQVGRLKMKPNYQKII